MKTKNTLPLIMLIAFSFAQIKTTHCQSLDNVFPGRGKSAFEISTGIPYSLAGEYVHGFTNRFAVGIFYGKNPTPGDMAFGLRFRALLFKTSNDFRAYADIPVLIYPETKKTEAWYIVYPNLMLEKKFHRGLRLAGGFGLIGAGCLDALLGEEEVESHMMMDNEKTSVFTDNGGMMGGVWCTINSTISFPVSKQLMIQNRFNYVLPGIQLENLHQKEWFYRMPVIAQLGIIYSL